MIDDAKLNELLALAEKATPGERIWDKDGDGSFNRMFVKVQPYKIPGLSWKIDEESVLSATGEHTQGWINAGDADATFIAACDPATIIALVQELKEKRFRLASLEK